MRRSPYGSPRAGGLVVAVHPFLKWRAVPAPQRGQLVRRYGELLREHTEDLAAIVAWEAGKISAEAVGEAGFFARAWIGLKQLFGMA